MSMTTVQGTLINPVTGQPVEGATVTATLTDYGVQENSGIIYPAGLSTTVTTDEDGNWEITLWSNTTSVTPAKYLFVIDLQSGAEPKSYTVNVPKQDVAYFANLITETSDLDFSIAETSVSPTQMNFTIFRNTSFKEILLYEDISGAPMFLQNHKAKLQVVDGTDTVFLTMSTDNGKITCTADGKIILSLTADDTSDMTPGNYRYDMLLRNQAGTVVVKFLQGNITVIDSITDGNWD